MSPLGTCQRKALDAYYELIAKFPELIAGRHRRPIIHDRQLLENYADENNCVLGVAASTPYSYFVVDLVESTDAHGSKRRHIYQRIIDRNQLNGGISCAVLAIIANPSLGRVGDIILIEQERHATGRIELGIPRGFGRPGLPGDENALRELREETGYVGEHAVRLATVQVDDGLTDTLVTFYHIRASQLLSAAPETEEAIVGAQLLSVEETWRQILAGQIRDPFTIQALALFQKKEKRHSHPEQSEHDSE